MKTVNEFINSIKIDDEWLDRYKRFVPEFINEAKTGKDWSDWNSEVFNQFFHTSKMQCVSSLQQGWFTKNEQEEIKKHWSALAPLLKQLAESQNEPNYELYGEIKTFIRSHTNNDMRAATHRLIASLQPIQLSTIVSWPHLRTLFDNLHSRFPDSTIPDLSNNWFKDSHAILKFYQEQTPSKGFMDIITLPWQSLAELTHNKSKNNDMSIDPMIETATQLLMHKYQIILQGAPGTGKTYMAKKIAKEVTAGNDDCVKLVQFHPSYTYEDFVRGIVVETYDGESPQYVTRNKILAEFAEMASKNLADSKKSDDVLSKEQNYEAVLDQFKEYMTEVLAEKGEYVLTPTTARITEVGENSFRYSLPNDPQIRYNLLFSDIVKIGTHEKELSRPEDVITLQLTMKSTSSYYFRLFEHIGKFIAENKISLDQQFAKTEKKNYVLIIDEINRANLPAVLGELIYALEYRNEPVESMYKLDQGDNKLILPENLYIIGTMNTADRSVGHIDYAIRRRFTFIDMLPRILEDGELREGDKFEEELFRKVSGLFVKDLLAYTREPSEHLSTEFRPEDVWLGQSYFITSDKHPKDLRLEYEIIPILKEYLRDGILKDSAVKIINELK